jgi:hypothetical protein
MMQYFFMALANRDQGSIATTIIHKTFATPHRLLDLSSHIGQGFLKSTRPEYISKLIVEILNVASPGVLLKQAVKQVLDSPHAHLASLLPFLLIRHGKTKLLSDLTSLIYHSKTSSSVIKLFSNQISYRKLTVYGKEALAHIVEPKKTSSNPDQIDVYIYSVLLLAILARSNGHLGRIDPFDDEVNSLNKTALAKIIRDYFKTLCNKFGANVVQEKMSIAYLDLPSEVKQQEVADTLFYELLDTIRQ